jgi:hypothetical protein
MAKALCQSQSTSTHDAAGALGFRSACSGIVMADYSMLEISICDSSPSVPTTEAASRDICGGAAEALVDTCMLQHATPAC